MHLRSVVIRTLLLLLVPVCSALTGCASIASGDYQVVFVEARNNNHKITGAICKLDNGKGIYFVTTPGNTTVHRAYGDLSVKCDKQDYESGITSVKSVTKAMTFGNILFGGVVGAAVDAGSGAAYDYPKLISVIMKEIKSGPVVFSDTSQSPVTLINSERTSK